MISAKNLTRNYGSFTAVDAVSFDIGPGEIVGLLGHNGAGKTTIMKMLTGYLEPTGGSIRIGDLDIGTDRPAIQRRIGYLPENCPVWPDMTVVEFLEYAALLKGRRPAGRRRHRMRCAHGTPRQAHAQSSSLCRAATASASASRRRSCTSRTSSSWTSRPTAWIRRRSSTCAR